VSQLRSQTTESLRAGESSDFMSTNGGIDEDKHMQLTKMSDSIISKNGPPLAVSGRSHSSIFDLGKPDLMHRSTDSSKPSRTSLYYKDVSE
jgi:hypothetical protein